MYEEGFERIEVDGIEILAIPHTTDDQFQKSLKEVRVLKKEMPRIVMLHAGILGVGMFRMNEVNELILDAVDIAPDADYVAMGHYHNHVAVTKNCCYAGSTERSSIAEAGVEKGFISLDLDNGKRKFVPLKTRRMVDAPSLNLKGFGATEATSAILRRIDSSDFEGSIARLKVTGLSNESRRGVDFNRIRRVAQKALSFDIRFEEQEEDEATQTDTARIGGLSEEFATFVSGVDSGRLDKKRLEKLAQELFSESEE